MSDTDKDDLLPEYDLDRLGPGERGKYAKRLREEGNNLVRIDPDLKDSFPDSASVNRALREYLEKFTGSE